MPILILIGIVVAWFIFGDPPKNIANTFWKDEAAPWESVDAFYYPDRSNLLNQVNSSGFDNIEACRDWVYSQAASYNDPNLSRGDYECGIGYTGSMGTLKVYRTTTR